MRERIFFILFGLLLPISAAAQTASYVTMTGTNANYAGGTMTANFYPPNGSSQFDYLKYHFPFTVSAPLNGSGAWTMSLADTSSVQPPNSQWRLQLCSAGTYGAPTCYTVTTPVTCISNPSCSGSTLDLSASFAGAPVPPSGTGLTGAGPNNLVAVDGTGTHAVTMAEKGTTSTAGAGAMAWDDDLKAGIYDPRDPRWAGGINGATPAAAAQAMSNQMACDLAMGKVTQAIARWPQGTYYLDQLSIAPGSEWIGAPIGEGGTTWHSQYQNHQLALAPTSMTLTCSDGNSHTDSLGGTRVEHFTLQGCAQGGCSYFPPDTATTNGNVGLELTSTGGVVDNITANAFEGYGVRVDGQDSKAFHLFGGAGGGNLEWYYYNGYKGVTESPVSTVTSTTTTGSTSSVALSWTAVPSATGYVVYRGTTTGTANACTFYLTTTNSFTDTGATGTNVCANAPNISNALAAPTGVGATPSGSGGTLPANTYYYYVTATQLDGWHGSFEIVGVDVMADWVESYGLFDLPTTFTYHHLADILFVGGNNFLDHAWPQRGQVGIAMPFGGGGGETVVNARVDFANLEGIWGNDTQMRVMNSIIGSSCFASNAQALNPQGTCDQLTLTNGGSYADGIQFNVYGGFGPVYNTADIQVYGGLGSVTNSNGTAEPNGGGPGYAVAGSVAAPQTTQLTNVTGPIPNVYGLQNIYPNDASAMTYTGFARLIQGQTLYILGGNANVTLQNGTSLVTCNGQNLNLGNYSNRYLEFVATNTGGSGAPLKVAQLCSAQPALASGYCTGTATASATNLSVQPLGGNNVGCTGTFQPTGMLMTGAGTLSNLSVRCNTTGISASSGVFTVHDLRSGTDTATPITITYGTTTAGTVVSDTAHSYAYQAGDMVRIEFTTQASETLGYCSVSFNY